MQIGNLYRVHLVLACWLSIVQFLHKKKGLCFLDGNIDFELKRLIKANKD